MKTQLQTRLTGLVPIIFISLGFVLSGSLPCFAGAWTLPKGKTYNRLALNHYTTDTSFNASGDEVAFPDNGEFNDTNVSYYMEHGLRDNLSLVLSLSYKSLEKEDDLVKSDFYGFSDLDLAVKYKLHESRIGVFSTQALIKIPELYDDKDDLPPGDGQYDVELRLMYGRSLYPMIPGYINLEAGYRLRDDELADEVRTLVEVGVDVTPRFYGRLKYEGIIGLNNADDVAGARGNPSSSPDYDLFKLNMALGFKLSQAWGIELEHIREIAGENISNGISYGLALTYVR